MDQANEAIQEDVQIEQPQEIETQEGVNESPETTDESEVEEAGLDAVEGDDEYEEIDYEGNKYRVPKELKDSFMRDKDYTQGKQGIAEQRQALEQRQAEFQQAAQLQSQNMQGHAQLAALQNQLQQYNNVDWNSFSEQDPSAAQKAFFQYSQLKDASTNLTTQLQQQESQALQQQQTMTAKRLEQGKAELARDIPNWSPETASKISSHGATYGFTPQELSTLDDPRAVKVLHDAMLYRQSIKKAVTTPKPDVKPISKVKGKAKGRPDPNKMSTEDWMKWRNKQLASK